MSVNNPADWLPLLNTIGFPLLAIYAHYKGWIVSPRELSAVQESAKAEISATNAKYEDLKSRHDRLESESREERLQMRQELAETRSLLIRVLAGEIKVGAAVDAVTKVTEHADQTK
jgi:hypothetical protein